MLRYRSKLERRLVRRVVRAVHDFDLLSPGDHVLVAVSGGKDSLALLHVLLLVQRQSPFPFRLSAITVDQEMAGTDLSWVRQHLRDSGVPHHLERAPIARILAHKQRPGRSPCALCSRLRRGALYGAASRLGATKIALGHHLDDLIETLLLNLFYAGRLASMAPRRRSDDGCHVVIRPLCTVEEWMLRDYSAQRGFQPLSCVDSGCAGPDSRRQAVKAMVSQLAQQHPQLRQHVLHALRRVHPESLLDNGLMRTLVVERR